LRHIGFESVKTLGGRGDRGIDGEGYLLLNRFVRTKVLFQCKRYQDSVGPERIRDFRGAIQGRADRGIFLTTGIFTREARSESERENATPIELVDIERLIDILIQEHLGLKERKALHVTEAFFDVYR
jgi:restriction system protein